MTPNEFRRHGREVVDWIADYFETIRDRPVLPPVQPGELTAELPAHGPEEPEPMDRILADFRERIVPANTHWNHPAFHAWFSISGTPPAVLAEALAAALNVNGMLWKSSPACTELEQLALHWLGEWLGLPPDWFGLIYDTASTAGVHALACARHRADPASRQHGNAGRHYTVYCSELAHSFIEKSAMTVGFGLDAVRRVPVDSAFRLRPDALSALIAADRATGRTPACIVATIGTTAVASVDPLPAIAEIAAREKLWLHVDAAYAGAAAVSEKYRHHLAGAAAADSFAVNPHKWLLTPTDLCAFYTRDPAALRGAFSLVPEYLRTDDGSAVNLMDYGFQLGRRFRALKLWFVMRSYGRRGVAAMIEGHCDMAADFASRLLADGRFEIAAPVEFSLVCFRFRGSDEENRALLEAINATGRAFLSHAVVDGRYVLRMAIGNWQTSREEMTRLAAIVTNLAPGAC